MSVGPQTSPRTWPGTNRPAVVSERYPRRIGIAVEAADVFSRAGVAGLVGPGQGIQLLPTAQLPQADVVVAVAPRLSGRLLHRLRVLREVCKPPFVLILDDIDDGDWLAAAEIGVAGAMSRAQITPDHFNDLIRTVAEGDSQLPPRVQGQLLREVAHLQQNVLAPRGLTASGLETREVDVLRLLADGLDTAEIAERMKYSERTVKNILYTMMTRLNLRNRSHAVAYAMRSGII
ncbi:response regulator transcription factor [Kineosporia rhizophila]|uniref:helix-turn-helix transcriptional regulator n=1 Tax=Kineosporia TaxID=49184 RepID=UPI001E4533FD|nr:MULTISPECIES: response regulator transcription factor [Kineosporia]MCE0535685.1 response regulator transcription factor [Kineosporia rhizophila]GLY17669.1 helix-turn-helix transcriptional regulator [Kineosporia sp. NBRC 101677]